MSPRVWNRRYPDDIPADAVYVGRPTKWGNPYTHIYGTSLARYQVGSREEAIEMFRLHVLPTLDVTELRGRDLVCWCAPLPCHGDLLLAAANGDEP